MLSIDNVNKQFVKFAKSTQSVKLKNMKTGEENEKDKDTQ